MNRIRLEPLTEQYVQAYFAAFSESITRYQMAEPFQTPEETRLYFRTLSERCASGCSLAFAVLCENGFCGSLEAHDLFSPVPEIGIWIAEEFRGNGIATEAMRMLIETLTRQGHTRFFFETVERNESAIRLVERFRHRKLPGAPETVVTASGKTLRLIRFTLF